MRPAPATFYIRDGDIGNPKFIGDDTLSSWVCNNGNSLQFRNFCHAVGFAFTLPALCHLVGHVRSLIAQEKVIRIDAPSHIAPVQDMLIDGNGPSIKLPRHAVRSGAENSSRPTSETPILAAKLQELANPNPATAIWVWYKALFEGCINRHIKHAKSPSWC